MVDDKIAEVISYIYIFHLTSLMSPNCLVKSAKCYNVSDKTVKTYSVRTSSNFYQFNNLW